MTDSSLVLQWVRNSEHSYLTEWVTDFGGENRALASTAVLAYVLGLRHALDADHISVSAQSTTTVKS